MRRPPLPLRHSHAIAFVGLAVGLAAGVVVGPMLAGATVTPIRVGQYCTPRGGVYQAPTLTMLCAQSISAARVVDSAWRWRDVTTPACPVGYARQVLYVQARPRGAAGVRPVQVIECVLIAAPSPPPSTPAGSGTTTTSPGPTPTPTASVGPGPGAGGGGPVG